MTFWDFFFLSFSFLPSDKFQPPETFQTAGNDDPIGEIYVSSRKTRLTFIHTQNFIFPTFELFTQNAPTPAANGGMDGGKEGGMEGGAEGGGGGEGREGEVDIGRDHGSN